MIEKNNVIAIIHFLIFSIFDKEYVKNFLTTRPLYCGNTIIEIIKNIDDISEYFKEAISDINKETYYFNKVYGKSFDYFPPNIKQMLIERLLNYVDIMNDCDVKKLKTWNLLKYKK